jgi:glycosyltransferase involved in cell wall biosynthesis
MKNEIIIFLPKVFNEPFFNLNVITIYLYYGMKEIGLNPKIVELSATGDQNTLPKNIENYDLAKYSDLSYYLEDYSYFLGYDVDIFLKYLRKTKTDKKILIWAQYFSGSRFIFKSYYDLATLTKLKKIEGYTSLYIIPPFLWRFATRKYVNTLRSNYLISQSLWTSLLLNRVYNLKSAGVVYLPVMENIFPKNYSERDKITIFFGTYNDTYIEDVINILYSIKNDLKKYQIISYGTSSSSFKFSDLFSLKLGQKIEHYHRIETHKLYELMSSSVFSISPIFVGTFEYMPIESLMCGTPVLTYQQPFMEVTGSTNMIANIEDPENSSRRILSWLKGIENNEINAIKGRILDNMDYRIVAKKIFYYINNLYSQKN